MESKGSSLRENTSSTDSLKVFLIFRTPETILLGCLDHNYSIQNSEVLEPDA